MEKTYPPLNVLYCKNKRNWGKKKTKNQEEITLFQHQTIINNNNIIYSMRYSCHFVSFVPICVRQNNASFLSRHSTTSWFDGYRRFGNMTSMRLGGCVSRHCAFIIVSVIVFVYVDGRRFQLAAGQYVVHHGPGKVPGGDWVLGRNERVQIVAARHLIVLGQENTNKIYKFRSQTLFWGVEPSLGFIDEVCCYFYF